MYLKAKNLIVNLATIGQPVTEGIKFYNFLEVLEPTTTPYIVASLTACEDDISLHLVHSILLVEDPLP